MAEELPQIPVGTPYLLGVPGGYVDMSVIASSGTRIICVEDLSSLGYSFTLRPYARFSIAPNRFAPIGEARDVFLGPATSSIISLTGPLQYVNNRVFLIIQGPSRPRVINLTLATS